MDMYKKINIILSSIFAMLALVAWFFWKNACNDGGCDVNFIREILKPLLWGSLALAIIFSSLLPFPSELFKKWLCYIGSWGLPLMFLGVLSTDPHSSNILSFGRGQVAWLLGTVVFAITACFIIGWYLWYGLHKKQQEVPLSRPAYLVPFLILFFIVSKMFW